MRTEKDIKSKVIAMPLQKSKVRSKISIPNKKSTPIPKIVLIATYPPRECGIATYTYDLKTALDNQFDNCFDVRIGAIENSTDRHHYNSEEVDFVLTTDDVSSYKSVANTINSDENIEIVMIQHEFGLFKNNEDSLLAFLEAITKPIIIAFHTVLPHPNQGLEKNVKDLVALAETVTVMTKSSAELLKNTYGVDENKIKIVSHGTHLVKHQDKAILKEKYNVLGRKVIATFGFLGPGKSIETTLKALPEISKEHPEILFLIVGKTHPTLFKEQGNAYMEGLQALVDELKIGDHVQFVNKFVPLPELLEYLQLADCYVFTSKDPNQAVSGTFSYAVSCGCPILSTPIPHAMEVLRDGEGLLFDFGNSKQLAEKLNGLLKDEELMYNMKMKGLHTSSSTSWENAAISHGHIFCETIRKPVSLKYKKPKINLEHLVAMTTHVGIIQFSKINTPDLDSGYTLDDNARALITVCENYRFTKNPEHLKLARTYINFILKCQRDNCLFLNYVDKDKKFTKQNNEVNLEDSNGRAIWALGYAYNCLEESIDIDTTLFQNIRWSINYFSLELLRFNSPRALAFAIKGLHFFNKKENNPTITEIINKEAQKLMELYQYNCEKDWKWFEPYLTYGNSVLPEALLYAWKSTGEIRFKEVAKESFDFLLSKIFINNYIRVISNQNWLLKGTDDNNTKPGGEQPIDVAYTILALKQFHAEFPLEGYDEKIEIAFNWFLGHNHLKQIIYNPCTGGCHDGLEEFNVNLNQGAESTISYLLARLAFEEV
ncbi:glycosyltransferase [Flavobacterium sp. UMI-01]|uniref:glycosyltransferase n=1 Tax=Flavobacterium sp. UMI-01 TaxID=1441053 RepID=UPI001C7DF7A0|nr:glycosyltransferase [Flavobacterium sp. UMI-01]GIZ08180.1 glycosyl transferase [Flavobacterium sp. UMI-01]